MSGVDCTDRDSKVRAPSGNDFFYWSSFSEKMLCWIKPDTVSLSALLSGSYYLQKDDVEIKEEYLRECLENDLRPLQQYMTGDAWANLMDEKVNGKKFLKMTI